MFNIETKLLKKLIIFYTKDQSQNKFKNFIKIF